MAAAGGAEAKKAHGWVGVAPGGACAELTPDELAEAGKKARKELLSGARPARAPPHLLLSIGTPGAGKSTVAAAVVAHRAPSEHYVSIDFDLAFRYHPRFADVWDLPSAVTGKPTGVGAALGYLFCNEAVEQVFLEILRGLLAADGPRYNIILQSHDHDFLITAKLHGYRTTLLYVGAPVAVAQARCRARAIATGKFLSPTLAAQDDLVRSMWEEYRDRAPWLALWADSFLIVDNGRGDPKENAKKAKPVDVRAPGCEEDWRAPMRAAEARVVAASGEKNPTPKKRARGGGVGSFFQGLNDGLAKESGSAPRSSRKTSR
jgi:predicted ABC-type ATPase